MPDHSAPSSDQLEGLREKRARSSRAIAGGRRLLAFPAKALQLLGLLIAFILLVAANGFAATHPALSAGLVFAFSLPYLLAAVVSRRAHFLYATMLLGAASYFLACSALGAPDASFPLLSVPLVFALWFVGQHLRRRLPQEHEDFPVTVFRAMNITVAVFSIWALVQTPGLILHAGFLANVAGLAFLGYAALYAAHALVGAPALYTYVFAMFITLGAGLLGFHLLTLRFAWAFVTAAAGVVFFLGTRLHRARTYRWSRHFFLSGGAVLAAGMLLALLSLSHFLLGLAAASLVLLLAYGWLAAAVGDVKGATTAERAVAKYLFYGALAVTAPAVPVVLALPGNRHVALPALLLGALWAWVAGQRKLMVIGGRNPFVLPAVFGLSAGLLGLSGVLPAEVADAWVPAVAVVMMGVLALLHGAMQRAGDAPNARSMAEAGVFPAFFAFYVPLMAGQNSLALTCAGAVFAMALLMAAVRRCSTFLYALGPAAAGAVVAGALIGLGQAQTAWIACAAVAAAAGLGMALATAGGRTVTRGAFGLAWLVLSLAAVAVAYAGGDIAQVLYSASAIASVAVLLSAEMRRTGARDAFTFIVGAVGLSATAAAVGLGPASGLAPDGAGLCLLAVALAHALAWGRGLSVWHARAGQAVLALALLLVIFGRFPALPDRLWGGAAAAALFFVLGALARRRFPQVSQSAVAMGHLTALVMAVTALLGAWTAVGKDVALATLPYLAIYALMPVLRKNTGFRLGAALWASMLVLLGLAAYQGVPYAQEVARVCVLALVWIAAGYGLRRIEEEGGALAFFVAGATLAVFCGAVSLFTPAVAGSWRVFLINGLAFAALFLMMRQDIFAYLLTFSFALMAYDWVKASTTPFTQDLLGYLVIGCGVLGVFFLLPHAKRLLMRAAAVPMFGIFTWRGAALVAVPVLGAGAVVLSAYSLEITQHPKFCIACHYMDNYYKSWQHSSHKDVACVECHYAPGVQAEVKGKMGGLVQVVKYVTHTYGNKPHADIQNASCMRKGCHANIKNDKEILLFEGKIRFRHDEHLTGQPRGKNLNCVSCHGQVVQGTHISVTETTCLTCHFYGRGDKPTAVGSCTSCHNIPDKTVSFKGQSFNHKAFLANKPNVKCVDCHSQVTQGDGHVSEARCRICHMSATLPIKDQVQFHQVHVSEQHFDCLQCHDEIRHGRHPATQQVMSTQQCNSCHDAKLHTIQEGIYAGKALKDLAGEPDAMYRAGVACTGCHSGAKIVTIGKMALTTKTSSSKQCVDCHNSAAVGNMLTMWQTDVKSRLADLQSTLKELEAAKPAAADQKAQWQKLIADAKEKLDVVTADGSNGAHNYGYVSTILDHVENSLNKCRSLAADMRKTANPEVALK